ncbi:unnamed protein product [Miscanthus lutarioriparius]|uniref:DUF1618 domain-containing protein n=1 Tax=Miscanthus lutarioriparius TaxID=422564 RepID=A0A811R1A1_9POAL|nr:unnamed protein product [Miscanthus lutarioriparius]
MGDAAAEQFSFSDWILVDPSNAMAAADDDDAASPAGCGDENARSVLLDVKAYSGASKNASTARSKTSSGHTIEVTFCTVPPPALSHISVHCPGLQLPPDDLSLSPCAVAVAAAADLVVLRVPVNTLGKDYFQYNDYFVYRAHRQDPKLDLLPNPWPYCFGDQEIAILSRGAVTADGDDNQYVVAALKIIPSFTLHLYRSKPCGETGSWTVQPVSVETPLRDSVCPIPDTAKRHFYHATSNVITLGGANGTVGWVDLWRGILLCDVLEERPKLRDVPLPLPAKGNWEGSSMTASALSGTSPSASTRSASMVKNTVSSPEPATYLEWVRRKDCLPPPTRSVVPGWWKAMPIPVTSWEDWHTECTAESHEFDVGDGDPRNCELLQELMSSSGGDCDEEEAKEAALSPSPAYGLPRLEHRRRCCINQHKRLNKTDVVYLSCKAASRGLMGLVAAVDVRKKELRVAKLDIERNTCFMRTYIATEISKYL